MDIETLKYFHLSCAFLSVSGFVLRLVWLWRDSAYLQHPLTKRLPHVVDSLLLFSGLMLAWQWPWQALQGWLPYKLILLLIYIALGMVALRFARSLKLRLASAVLALFTVGLLITVALTKLVF